MRVFVSALAGGLIVGAGALAQESGVTVTNDIGAVISLSPAQVYRALGDRLVSGNDVVGNNTRRWNQIDPFLSASPIRVALPYGLDDADLLDMIRYGCREYAGSPDTCSKVGLRRDVVAADGPRVARIDAMRLESALPTEQVAMMVEVVPAPPPVPVPVPVPPPPPPPPPAAPIAAPVVAVPAMVVETIPLPDNESAPLVAPVPTPAPVTTRPVVKPPAPMARRATGEDRAYASRLFAGRDGLPPEALAPYGILAFRTLSTDADRQAYLALCEAFFGTVSEADDAAADIGRHMVTVWPIDDRRRPDLIAGLNATRAQEGSCENTVEDYDIQIARGAIGDARQAGVDLSGRGPFLLAWAPAGMKGHPDAVVLAADLGNVKTVADAKDVLRVWRENIERDPDLWQDGFSVEAVRQIADRYGNGLLKFFGG